MPASTLLIALLALSVGAAQVAPPQAAPPRIHPAVTAEDRHAIEAVLKTYNDGLTRGDLARFRSALDDRLLMFNGAFSADPTDWEAHMYVAPERIDQWVRNYVEGAGPHANRFVLLGLHVRANAAVATTEDTGHNRFRKWEKERVTWLLGRRNDQWKIVGYFIRDIRNP